MTTATNVSAGKPKVGGAIFAAPVGTPLPVSATEELNEAFKSLGYCSDDGVTNSTALETEKIKAWGGDTVLIINKSKDDTFKYKLIEAKSKEVLAYVYGDDNVSGTLETGLKVKVNSSDVPERSIVIDMILRGDTLKRIVIPSCKISAVADIEYGDDNAIGYETTVDCTPDANGDTHIEYLQKTGSPSA
jgi:hypothetical protein